MLDLRKLVKYEQLLSVNQKCCQYVENTFCSYSNWGGLKITVALHIKRCCP